MALFAVNAQWHYFGIFLEKLVPKHGGWESKALGDRLRELRNKAGLTQKNLAEKAGCNQATIAKIETRGHQPAWPLMCALADALGVGVEEFRVPAKMTGGVGGEETESADQPPPKRKRGRPKKQ